MSRRATGNVPSDYLSEQPYLAFNKRAKNNTNLTWNTPLDDHIENGAAVDITTIGSEYVQQKLQSHSATHNAAWNSGVISHKSRQNKIGAERAENPTGQPTGQPAAQPCPRADGSCPGTKSSSLTIKMPISIPTGDMNWYAIWLAFFTEMIGLALIITASAGAYTAAYLVMGGGIASIATASVAGAIALAFSYQAALMGFGVLSTHGHFNPGFTILSMLQRRTSWPTALAIILGQLAGSFIGALILGGIFGFGVELDLTATFVDPHSFGFGIGAAITVELVGGFLLHLAYLRAVDMEIGAVPTSGYMAAVYGGVYMFGVWVTGASYNFFRTLGPAIISGTYNPVVAASWWIYPVFHLVSVFLAWFVNMFLVYLFEAKLAKGIAMASSE